MSSPPSTLGQYQIIREIARSNDIVYEAYDPLMNRRVAVKELSMPSGSTAQQKDDRISRFKREAQAAGTLNHPNIMTVYSFAEDAGRTFMAMEYLDGQTLRNELDTKGTIPLDRAVEIACSVLDGLEHAHNKGVIHRDIKPDNIQILSTGAIKITDFGIARLTFQPNLTIDGQVFGTPSYMSPEQVVGRDIDARSDLFSVGVLLYEMLAGKKPFSGDSVVSTTYAIMNAEPERPPSIAWPIWSVIDRALAKSPAARFSSASEMEAAIKEAVSPGAGVIPPDAYSPPVYGANPFLSPSTPPPSPYLNQAPPPPVPIQAPYNPYAAPSANSNPYAGQYQQQQNPGTPITYPYNPFASQAGGGTQIPQGGMVAPIYYPPPPRQPLLKPETSIFLRKLFIAFLVFGTLAALLVVLTGFVLDAVGQGAQAKKIAQAKDFADKARLANETGQSADAENYLDEAQSKDPHNPTYSDQQGKNFWSTASQTTDLHAQAELYIQSAREFQQAADDEANVTQKQVYGVEFADAAINAASVSIQLDDSDLRRQARQLLSSAKAYAASDPGRQQTIGGLIPRISS